MQTMKIIHCADIHLDSKMNANLTREKAKERKAELLATFRRMVEYAKQQKIDAVLIAGDLFDTKNVSVTARNLVRDTIMKAPEISFFYLQGNHDEGSFTGGLEQIPENLFLFGEAWTCYTPDKNGKVVITGVELNSHNKASIYNTLSLDMEKFNIVMLHGQESAYCAKDKAEVISLNSLKNQGIDYLALGHVHAYKKARLDTRGEYCYPGCLEGRGFDECGEHGFVVLTVSRDGKQQKTEFVPFASRSLYTIEADVTGCQTSTDILEKMTEASRKCAYPPESLIKFELTGNMDVESEKNLEYLAKEFADEYYFVKIKDSTAYRVDYEAFELDMSLKGEFIRTVKAQTDLTEGEKAEIIRMGIRALAGEV